MDGHHLLAELIEAGQTNLDDFLFFDDFNDEFLQLSRALASPATCDETFFSKLFDTGSLVFARSIDGDFLMAKSATETWVIPRSFNNTDIEKFFIAPKIFLEKFQQHQSPSQYIR
ncbi:hypothetical protein [Enterococcus timonensis]|uniref:hypothetical protein n=1 Tax=Enterococcus timonensis TaxID=1852364 RepID=UPI0008DA1C45|nr:hypothetical protein [Enterococcus timonensis]